MSAYADVSGAVLLFCNLSWMDVVSRLESRGKHSPRYFGESLKVRLNSQREWTRARGPVI
jgi:hypothetical protein